MQRRVRRIALVTAGALSLLAPATAPAAQTARTRLPGSTPRWAQPSRDRGDASGSQPVTVRIYLPLRDAATALSMVQSVSDPGSASYGQFMTPDAFRQRFAPAAADVNAVKSFLTSSGLSIGDVPGNNIYVEATGSLATAEKAFGVDVRKYGYRGHELEAPSSAPSVPSSLASKVVAVTGLDDSGVLTRPMYSRGSDQSYQPDHVNAPVKSPPTHGGKGSNPPVPPPDAFVNAPPCSNYFGEKIATQYPAAFGSKQPFAPCGYTPSQFQGAYGLKDLHKKGVDGRGVTVAITDAYAAPTILQDANTYAQKHGQAAFRSGQFSQIVPRKFNNGYNDKVNGDQCGEQGWYGEETLDVEAVHATAPGANVLYVAGASCFDDDLLTALNTIVDGRKADIITNSWGDIGEDTPPDTANAYNQLFMQAALEGIGVFYSSGDDGDDSLDTEDGQPVVDFPSSHPLVTAVGGTSLGVGRLNDYQFETGWATGISALNDAGTAWDPAPPGDFLYGGGGGVSSVYSQPWYQRNVVPPSIANGKRATPDIAMDGDPSTGMLVGETQTFPDGSVKYAEYRIGGTSLSSPLYAGVEALADQAQGRPHGFVNPALYALNGTPGVRDITQTTPHGGVVRVDYNNSVDGSEGTHVSLRTLNDEAQSLHDGPRWDTLTGVGTPNGNEFIRRLSGR
jgi:subtilase family serine protease